VWPGAVRGLKLGGTKTEAALKRGGGRVDKHKTAAYCGFATDALDICTNGYAGYGV